MKEIKENKDKKYTVYYKRISQSQFTGGRDANVEVQHAMVTAGNTAGAVAKVREQQKMYMNRDIRVISIIREITEE